MPTLPTDINDSPNYTSDDHADHHNTVHAFNNGVVANRQTASYTLVLADLNKVVEMNVASANNLTVPPNSSVAFPVGTVIEVMQYGAGQTTIVAGSGVTLRTGAGLAISAQYGTASLRKIATDEWHVIGDLADAAWTSWTPTLTNLTLGDGTLSCKHTRSGRTVHYRFRFVLGATSAVGTAPAFTLPVPQSDDYNGSQSHLGNAILNDATGNDFIGYVQDGGGSVVRINYYAESTAGVIIGTVQATVPFTWASGDSIEVDGTYETAT